MRTAQRLLRRVVSLAVVLFCCLAASVAASENYVPTFKRIKAGDSVAVVLNHPAFKGFSQFLLPGEMRRIDNRMGLGDIDYLLPYHSHIRVETTVTVLNHLIDEVAAGVPVFHAFYTDAQKAADPTKANTGLFFFKGKPGEPFAIVCPGGGFSYVGSIHEGIPHALELSKRGYNAFVIQYRVGSGQRATEDLAAAMSYVFRNAATLEIGTDSYSLWGGSAGARMVAYMGSHGAAAFGGDDLPQPAAIIMAYTGHSELTRTDPPTFVMVSDDDPIVSVSVVERRVQAMQNAGIDVEYHMYHGAGHGFGLGIGTDAEGWVRDATIFWEKHIKPQP
ncbi:alpha/beta hydrolase [Pseudodesulfovibrio piezophilus]|uniref:Esterase/lipase (Modular protein) n=1 Tax=Pseudodesulfovibrio piezophilus (strain DSM 21447 / JCM 15486 / C1TLV30) TaxID=1322246 RepID=M1WPH4_PSEP2|nr:prolyl oligopeptidase family serine peptidase [Pseudodesulfovibrio piezophilus]CCH48364.1 Esterase/lipase (modular protein) [Pseudodesulfovibrio piezophilus C1TLV30]